MIDAAIVGLGRWGRNFVESVHGQSERIRFVRAVVLTDPAIQAVVLVTPHSTHRPLVEAAARAGKQVFCEKPLALTAADAAAMIDACRRAGVVLGVGLNRRLWPTMVRLKQLVDAGELGDVLHIEGHFSNEFSNNTGGSWRDSPAESPGGGMTGTGVHLIDAFINLCGPFRRVRAQMSVRKPPPAPRDSAVALVEFASGASGSIASVRPSPLYWRVHVFGDRGSAESLGERELVIRKSRAEPERLTFEPVNTLRAELEAFADAVEGRAPFHISAAEMLATVAAFEATIQALASDAPVLVGELPA
jgi:predicted dehydrogenase